MGGSLAASIGLTVTGGGVGGCIGMGIGECMQCGSYELFMAGTPLGAAGGAIAANAIFPKQWDDYWEDRKVTHQD